jgi:ATP-dependent RNA helicase DeaD
MNSILAETPKTKRTLLFSATMPREVASIAANYMNNPLEITVGTKNAGNENVVHEYYVVHASDRYNALKRIADMNPDIYGIIFCRTRQETNEVAEKLINDGYSADALHGDLSQVQRDYVMQKFRLRNIQMLVATDVAARGLDVNELTHVINYNLPDDIEVYTHRSGRTGRAGRSGTSISIIHARERFRIERLEKMLHRTFERKKVPGGKEICERQLMHLADKICGAEIDEGMIGEILPRISEKFASLSREEIISRFVSAEISRFLDYYKNTPDLDIPEHRGDVRKPKGERLQTESYTRFFMNIGRADGMQPQNMMSLINKHTRNRSIGIGRTQIMNKVSFFEADSRFSDDIVRAFQNASFGSRKLVVEVADGKDVGAEPRKERGFIERKKFRPESGPKRSRKPKF